jgi:hypothetical protein
MTDVAMWDLVVGFVSATFVLPILQQPRWSTPMRAGITFAYSVLVGIGVVYFTGGFGHPGTGRGVVASILLVLVSAISTYHGFAKPTGIAPTIETATSPSRP